MAKGSWRRFPTAPTAAAVVSEATIEPINTPLAQSRDCPGLRGVCVLVSE